ncbi:MAG TPA: hypothetical protein VI434_14260 [Candidatus Dormibacteraeota bacterium]
MRRPTEPAGRLQGGRGFRQPEVAVDPVEPPMFGHPVWVAGALVAAGVVVLVANVLALDVADALPAA